MGGLEAILINPPWNEWRGQDSKKAKSKMMS